MGMMCGRIHGLQTINIPGLSVRATAGNLGRIDDEIPTMIHACPDPAGVVLPAHRLRIYREDGLAVPLSPDEDVLDRLRSNQGGPLAIQAIHHQTPGECYQDLVCLWHNGEALVCRLCPAGRCNFAPGPDGQSVCIVRRLMRAAFVKGNSASLVDSNLRTLQGSSSPGL